MSKAFIANVIQDATECTGTVANQAAGDLLAAIVNELKQNGGFTLPSFGTYTVRKTKARKALNPPTGESIKVKAGKTVRAAIDRGRDDPRCDEVELVGGIERPCH